MRLFFLLIFLVSGVQAQVKWPALTSPVVDEARLLSSQDRYEIEKWIRNYRQQGKAQLQVLIVPDLQGLPIEQYSIEVVERWKLGGEKADDGVLLLVSTGDRQMRIEVGQGLEGALTDIQAKRILDDRVRPLFRSQQFAAGIATAISEIIKAVDPEYISAAPVQEDWQERRTGNRIFLFMFLLFIFMNIFGRRSGRRRSAVLPFLMGMGAGSAWGRGGGFGGGGGWSGGGGGFSGGGASSNW